MFSRQIEGLASEIISVLAERGQHLSTAESCTGGLLAGALTAVTGASKVYHGGFVTYSNGAKQKMLGVDPALLMAHGAVSEPVARAMAEGACRETGSAYAVSVTGIAGPDGGSATKPVGLVHLAVTGPMGTQHAAKHFGNMGRNIIRLSSVEEALDMLKFAIHMSPKKHD